MKLYKVQPGSKVKVIKGFGPPESPIISKGDVLEFARIDGMYSTCFRDKEKVYLSANAEVEILDNH